MEVYRALLTTYDLLGFLKTPKSIGRPKFKALQLLLTNNGQQTGWFDLLDCLLSSENFLSLYFLDVLLRVDFNSLVDTFLEVQQ